MIDELRKKLNSDEVIVPPVPRDDFWTDPAHFNLQPDPMEIWESFESRIPYRVEAHSFRRSGKPVFAFWIPEHVELTAATMHGSIYMQMGEEETLKNPVVLDPIRRNVWLLKDLIEMVPYRGNGGGNFFGTLRIHDFPVADWPLLVADASILHESGFST